MKLNVYGSVPPDSVVVSNIGWPEIMSVLESVGRVGVSNTLLTVNVGE